MVEFYIVSKCPMEGLYKNEKLPLQVQWVKGHARNAWNIRCDKTAKAEAKLRVG